VKKTEKKKTEKSDANVRTYEETRHLRYDFTLEDL